MDKSPNYEFKTNENEINMTDPVFFIHLKAVCSSTWTISADGKIPSCFASGCLCSIGQDPAQVPTTHVYHLSQFSPYTTQSLMFCYKKCQILNLIDYVFVIIVGGRICYPLFFRDGIYFYRFSV